jgi:hypothetical protein
VTESAICRRSEYEVTSGGRVGYVIDDEERTVWSMCPACHRCGDDNLA